MEDEQPKETENTPNPVVAVRHEAEKGISEALQAPAATEKTASEAFKSFGKPKPSKIAEAMLEIGKGKKPQIGAIAFLHADEEDAVEGYEKALAFFKGDIYATNMILSIIDDEQRHERNLCQLFGMYAAVPSDGE